MSKKAIDVIAEVEVLPATGETKHWDVEKVSPRRTLVERIKVINDHHGAAMSAMGQAAMHAIMCGFELHAAKAELPHGEWAKWVVKNCEFSFRTAQCYMQVAARKVDHIAELSHVRDFSLGVAPHQLTAPQRQRLTEAIKDTVDDKSIRQMYLDLGIITEADPKARGGDHGGGAARAAQAATSTAMLNAKAEQEWDFVVKGLQRFVRIEKNIVRLERHSLNVGIETLTDCLKSLRTEVKQRKIQTHKPV